MRSQPNTTCGTAARSPLNTPKQCTPGSQLKAIKNLKSLLNPRCNQPAAMAMASTFPSKPQFDPCKMHLPSVPAIIAFYHACMGFLVKQTWLEAIKEGNCNTFKGLTYANVALFCLDVDETILGHLAQTRQNVRSTEQKSKTAHQITLRPPTVPNQEIHLEVSPISKLFTDNTGRFPTRAWSGNQYLMIAYHADGNLILQQAFQTKADNYRIPAFNAIMTRLAARGMTVNLNVRDNEASTEFRHIVTQKWQTKFQLVPPHMHRQIKAERMIRHFKNHFLSILVGVDAGFPPYLWDLLLPQAEITINLLRQAAVDPKISAWEFFNSPFGFNKTPLAPMGCRVLIHAKATKRRS